MKTTLKLSLLLNKVQLLILEDYLRVSAVAQCDTMLVKVF